MSRKRNRGETRQEDDEGAVAVADEPVESAPVVDAAAEASRTLRTELADALTRMQRDLFEHAEGEVVGRRTVPALNGAVQRPDILQQVFTDHWEASRSRMMSDNRALLADMLATRYEAAVRRDEASAGNASVNPRSSAMAEKPNVSDNPLRDELLGELATMVRILKGLRPTLAEQIDAAGAQVKKDIEGLGKAVKSGESTARGRIQKLKKMFAVKDREFEKAMAGGETT